MPKTCSTYVIGNLPEDQPCFPRANALLQEEEIQCLQAKVNMLETENAELKESMNGYDAEKFLPGSERDVNLILRDGTTNRGWYSDYDRCFKMYDENLRSGFSIVYDDNPVVKWRELK